MGKGFMLPIVVCVFCLLLASAERHATGPGRQVSTEEKPKVISGQVVNSKGPLAGVEVTLWTYRDEKCMKLMKRPGAVFNEEEQKEIKDCHRELSTVKTDGKGHFELSGLKPGWFELTFRLHLSRKLSPIPSAPPDGEYTVFEIEGWGKHFVTLAGKPLYFSGKESIRRNVDFGEN